MASIRRTLSPVPRPGALSNGEACQVASPLSKSSSNSHNPPSPRGGVLSSLLSSLDYALYRVESFVIGLFSRRSSRPVDRSRMKGQMWRRAYLYFVMCFFVGVFVGLTPFVPLNISTDVDFELLRRGEGGELYVGKKNEMSVVGNTAFEPEKVNVEVYSHTLSDNSSGFNDGDVAFDKLLIIITPTHARPLRAYFLNRLAHTLRLIRDPLLWIVVEMNSQSVETAELLRNSGVMYRHLVGSFKNATEIKDRSAILRNVALSHIETHRLDGIAYFADDDKIYSTGLFDQMRNVSRIGTWMTAKLVQSRDEILFEGPICNSSKVVGWHVDGAEKRRRRFHADMSGFAFNSTVIWDPKRWHRPTIEPIRQLESVRQDVQASEFIGQLVEDESQMECFSSGIMVWHHTSDAYSYPRSWFSSILGAITPLN